MNLMKSFKAHHAIITVVGLGIVGYWAYNKYYKKDAKGMATADKSDATKMSFTGNDKIYSNADGKMAPNPKDAPRVVPPVEMHSGYGEIVKA